jgi:hypothetical protein
MEMPIVAMSLEADNRDKLAVSLPEDTVLPYDLTPVENDFSFILRTWARLPSWEKWPICCMK